MAELVQAIPTFLMHAFVPVLIACIAAWLGVLYIAFLRKQVRPDFSVSRRGRRVPSATCAVIGAVMFVCTLFSGKNTNGVNNIGGMYLMQFNPPAVQSVTPEDVSNGWRVTEVSGAVAFAPPPANAVTNERWCLRGAHDDAFRIPSDGWSYPFASGVTVLSRGEIRRGIRSRDFPRAFEQDLSLLPVVNWQLLPDGRNESVFWHGATPSNTLIATWWNAALGRDATNPVCFQAELHTNGGFDYRYDDRTVRHVRVWPFDIDDDGLENSVDPYPLTAGPDAHGTSAEWYNTVCSNVFEVVDGGTGTTGILPVGDGYDLSWRDGVNTNAYYFVDVVASEGPAPIYFTGDRESSLGNPVVVARAFETNRVPLLIGVNYTVTSTVPLAVSFPVDYVHPTVTTNGVSNYEVRWPLEFVFTESIGESNRVYTATVEPYDPGGTFTSDPPLRGAPCGCASFSGWSIVFGCSPTCDCGGNCPQGILYYLLSGATFAATGGVCRCGFDDPLPPAPVSYDPTNAPSLSVTFSKPAVIFEEAYLDSEYGARPKRSTRVQLTVSAYGGTHGGSLSLSSQNLGKLAAVGGGVIELPAITNIPPYESFFSTCAYEAATLSNNEDDISVTGQFIEDDSGTHIDKSDSLTAVQLLVLAATTLPQGCPNRHTFGVCERMSIFSYPNDLSGCTWATSGMVREAPENRNSKAFDFLLEEGPCAVTFTLKGTSYTVHTMCLRPRDIISLSTPEILLGNAGLGEAGGIGMRMRLTLMPDTVSFIGLRTMENITEDGVASGYFGSEYFRPWWNHGMVHGAGESVEVGVDNHYYDQAEMEDVCPQLLTGGWATGSITWTIPTVWRERQDFSVTNGWTAFTTKAQIFTINSAGTVQIEKFNCSVERDVQGHTNATVNLPLGR